MTRTTAIIFGSSLGNTRFVAEKLHKLLAGSVLLPVHEATPERIGQFSNLILGTSTWGVGMLQDEFETFVEMLVKQDLNGKTIALFGLGDQHNYPDTFCDGMGKLFDLLQDKGAQFVGHWPADDYDFATSRAVRDEMFVGLALDEDNEPDLTDFRLRKWVESIEGSL